MGGGGSFFGSLANAEQNVRKEISPIADVLDPIGSYVVNQTNDFTNKPWIDQREKAKAAKNQQQPTVQAPISEDGVPGSVPRKSASGAAQGPGAINTAMVTNPPDTEEGNKLRLAQSTMLG